MARQYKVSVITPFHNTDDEIFKRSNGEIIDECDYTEGLMIYA